MRSTMLALLLAMAALPPDDLREKAVERDLNGAAAAADGDRAWIEDVAARFGLRLGS